MLKDPSSKYTPYTPVPLPTREWPARITTKAPIWLSTDLRDGNQSLPAPMTVDQKLELFRHLVKCGFKEIEVAFPAASETETRFVRRLVEEGEVPDDVWIQVMTPARRDCIEKTFAATRGAKHVITQLYNAAAPDFRDIIYRYEKPDVVRLAAEHTRLVRALSDAYARAHGTRFRLAYAVEGFTQTEPAFAVEVCEAVKRAWGCAGTEAMERIMFIIPATVEVAPPNHYADQVEYFLRNISEREKVLVGVHTHNDRGTAVAAAEMALLAGAERVDGTLFGNGERTGNMDLVTLALNLYSQGISPNLDFSHLQQSIDIITACTALPIHPRHPYAGSLVYTAFSGAHQDGIHKGFTLRRAAGPGARWRMPYLPVDPADFGFTYEAAVRVNSQSGKGGVAHVLGRELRLARIPRALQVAFQAVVQDVCDREAREMRAGEIARAFRRTYYFGACEGAGARLVLGEHRVRIVHPKPTTLAVLDGSLVLDGVAHVVHLEGHDIAEATLHALQETFDFHFTLGEQHSEVVDAVTVTYLQLLRAGDRSKLWWGVGEDEVAATSIVRAIIGAVNCSFGPSQA